MKANTEIDTLEKKTKKDNLWKVPFSRMELAPNIRTDLGDIEELAASIRENGIQKPIEGYIRRVKGEDEVYVVIDGQRRFTAMQLLYEEGIDVVAPFIGSKKPKDEDVVFRQITSAEGKALTPLEQAEAFAKLVNYGYTVSQIAEKLGKNENGKRWIQKLLHLADAPEKLKKLVRKGKVSSSLAVDIVAKGEEAIQEVIQKVEAGESVQDTTANDGSEITQPKPAKSKITKGSLNEINSKKELDMFIKNVDTETLPEAKAKFVEFLLRVKNNEVSYEAIRRFFKKED